MDHNNSLTISCIHIHVCGDIAIQEILYHYHDVDNYITIIDKTITLHITSSMTMTCDYVVYPVCVGALQK